MGMGWVVRLIVIKEVYTYSFRKIVTDQNDTHKNFSNFKIEGGSDYSERNMDMEIPYWNILIMEPCMNILTFSSQSWVAVLLHRIVI